MGLMIGLSCGYGYHKEFSIGVNKMWGRSLRRSGGARRGCCGISGSRSARGAGVEDPAGAGAQGDAGPGPGGAGRGSAAHRLRARLIL